jgi:hypothetical protein
VSRAEYSRGATNYLLQLFDRNSLPSRQLSQHIDIAPQLLQDEFIRGLGSPNADFYSRGVGRIHIVDMLGDALERWPEVPREGVAALLIASIVDSARAGDKPKALVYLDALEACHGLTGRGLDTDQPLAERLGQRLLRGARAAKDHRAYFPTRNIHNKIVSLIQRGISPSHHAFPQEVLDNYLEGEVASDDDRQALERYVFILDRLNTLGVDIQSAESAPFTRALRSRMTHNVGQLATLIQRLDKLPRETAGQPPETRRLDRIFADWETNPGEN